MTQQQYLPEESRVCGRGDAMVRGQLQAQHQRVPRAPYLMAPPGHRGDDVAPGRVPLHVGGHVVLCDVHDRAVRSVNKRQGTVHAGDTDRQTDVTVRVRQLASAQNPTCARLPTGVPTPRRQQGGGQSTPQPLPGH